MIFLGDVAAPFDVSTRAPELHLPDAGLVVANLEGPLRRGSTRERLIFNDVSVPGYLRRLGVRVVSLANNHVLDGERSTLTTTAWLDEAGLAWCGAGDDPATAARPAVVQEDGRERVFLAFGWETIQCRAATETSAGVNPLRPAHVLESTRRARAAHPDATLVLLVHWNYELEAYPQPLHRELAFRAIDAGADAVIGSHSHCVAGVEVYRGRPVVYGLGNWLIPQGVFWGEGLTYPDRARDQLAFEWDPESGRMVAHRFEYEPGTHALLPRGSEPLEQSRWIESLTPFRGMSHGDYARWFARNRLRRKGLPVYRDVDAPATNWARDRWMQARDLAVRAAVVSGLKR